MAALLGAPAPARDDLAAKRALIVDHGLAVWDVVCRCTIAGASDASIRDVVPNAVPKLAARLGVQAVFCNGGTAARLYRKYLEPAMGPAAGTLPSTSPAQRRLDPAPPDRRLGRGAGAVVGRRAAGGYRMIQNFLLNFVQIGHFAAFWNCKPGRDAI